jgi:hypothetical protein
LVDEADIPTAAVVHALAAVAGQRGWWRGLEILAVAYSGLRWGEMAALTADSVVGRRRILVDRRVVEGRHGLALAPPKNRRRPRPRTGAGAPPCTRPARPEAAELATLLARGLAEPGGGRRRRIAGPRG